MLFRLAQGKSRMVADPQGRGFFIVKTNKIVARQCHDQPDADRPDPGRVPAGRLGRIGQQMLSAMKADQGVKRNEKAIAAARQRITGAGN